MDASGERLVVKVNGSVIARQEGEVVVKGESLGYFSGGMIRAPFDAVIEKVSFGGDRRAVLISLIESVAVAQ